jgi:parallel beta-helix repeat protein
LLAVLSASAFATQTYSVTKTNDDGSSGTLRWAIQQSEQDGTDSVITIDVSKVTLGSNLPSINSGRLTINGKGATIEANSTSGLSVNSSYVSLSNFTLSNSHQGISLSNASGCTVNALTITGTSTAAALTFTSSSDNTVSNCVLTKGNQQGILVQNGSNRNMIGPNNYITENDSGIMLVNTCTDTVISSSSINDNTGIGILVYSGSVRTTIGPNDKLYGNGQTGIVIDAGTAKVTDSEIKGSGQFGVFVDSGGANAQILHNTIDECQLSGIFASNTSNVTVATNTLLASKTQYGVTFDGVTGGTIGPENRIALNGGGGISLNNSDPCTVFGNPVVAVNFGPGIHVTSTKGSNQKEVLIASNVFLLNSTGVDLTLGSQKVRVRQNNIFANVASGVSILGSVPNPDLNVGHVIEGNIIQANGYSGLSSFFASGIQISCNLVTSTVGPGIDLQHGGAGDFIHWNLVQGNCAGVGLVMTHDVTIEDNYILNNRTFGVDCNAEPHIVRNNVILGNHLCGITTRGIAEAKFVNNTVVGNGAGLAGSGFGWNNILYFNQVADAVYADGLTFYNCDIGAFLGGNVNQNGCFSKPPQFRDYAKGDLHLADASPCRNKGSNNAPNLPSYDFDASPFTQGDPRILESVVDVGADESGGSYLNGGSPEDWLASVSHLQGFTKADMPSRKEAIDFTRKLGDDERYYSGGGLKTYTVTNLNDTGAGSLRDAITMANQDQSPSLVTFDPKLRGSIYINSNLPPITDVFGGTEIDGSLDSDGVTPKIKVAAGSGAFCSSFVLHTPNNAIKNFEIDVSADAFDLYGRASNNLIENVRVRNTQSGLAFGIINVSNNVFRRCVATNNLWPGFYIVSGADNNVFEDCVAENNNGTPGTVIAASSGNRIYGTAAGRSRMNGNSTGVVLLIGAQNNVIGPNVEMKNNTTMGVSLDGVLTMGNKFTGITASDNQGPGVHFGNFASNNRLEDSLIERNLGNNVNLSSAPDTVIEGNTITGHSSGNDFLIIAYTWSPRLQINANKLKASGSGGGIYVRESDACSVTGNKVDGAFDLYASGIAVSRGNGGIVRANVVGSSGGSNPDTGIMILEARDTVVLQNSVFVGNNNGYDSDVGISVGDSSDNAVIGPDNEVTATTATSGGQGVYVGGAKQYAVGVKVARNTITGAGKLAYGVNGAMAGGGLVVDSNDISGTTSAGVWLGNSSTSRLVNNTLHDNGGTAILMPWDTKGKQPQVLFNTVVCSGKPIYGDGRVWYNIFWSNSELAQLNTSRADIHCNDVQGRAQLGLPPDNSEIDPKFVNPTCGGSGDYHLRSDSPLIDYKCSGSPPSRPNHDMDNDPRPHGTDYDLGQDEHQ